MRTVLVLFFLSVQSSYTNNSEIDATDEVFDTVQFYGTESGSWRIKTYATDQDVHIWSIGVKLDDLIAAAQQNTLKNYGDILTEGYIIDTVEGVEGLRKELAERGLADNLEVPPSGAIFWAPPGTKYRSKSAPR
jgi:hypothetical protein